MLFRMVSKQKINDLCFTVSFRAVLFRMVSKLKKVWFEYHELEEIDERY